MKIAYIVHAYTQPALFGRLISVLNSDGVYFFVHIDKRVDIAPFKSAIENIPFKDNVCFIKREESEWGSVQCIKMVLNGLRDAVVSDMAIDYFYFLSGQDYPIKSNKDIINYLANNSEKDFVPHAKLSDGAVGGVPLDRYNRRHLIISKDKILRRLVKAIAYLLPKRTAPLGYTFYWGEFYMGVSRSSAEYILDFLDKNPSYLEFFKYSYIPEEAFFQTLLCNRPASDCVNLVNRTLTYVDWSRPNKASPATLRLSDFETLKASDCLFARKFDERASSDLLYALDEMRNADC